MSAKRENQDVIDSTLSVAKPERADARYAGKMPVLHGKMPLISETSKVAIIGHFIFELSAG